MYPHERSLVKRLQNEPFALIGVNSDKDLDELRPRLEEENITWRSFWNGLEGTGGPISTTWNVRGWPTVYLIDHEGRIRFKNVRGEKELDEAIDGQPTSHGTDLVSVLMRAEDDEVLSSAEMRTFVFTLLVAGSFTTQHLISNTVLALLDHPEALERLAADPSLVSAALDEYDASA